ncbi:MAG: class I SAM-dependent RNA methyltransferase [OCS116 cluster bacterium]|nr:class I SAM-dependent RNA methyltransferase [OCS116 cluster bacterium]
MQVKIDQIGHKGHGIAQIDGKPVYIPFALPNEIVELNEKLELSRVIEPSSDRIKAKCKHFTKCGSCVAQHMAPDFYDEWKKSSLIYALEQHGIDKQIDQFLRFDETVGDLNRRRRVKLAAKRTKKSMMIGYSKAQSHDIIPLEECPIVTSNILAIVPKLADFIKPMMSRKGVSHIGITDYSGAIEIKLDNVKYEHSYDEISYVNEQTEVLNIARLVINDELILQRKDIIETFDGVSVTPVAAGFMQAVKAAELAMSGLVKGFLGDVKGDIVDLFSGIGTFTFALAQSHQIDAFDYDKFAIQALQNGFNMAGGVDKLKLKTVTATGRDLYRRPLFKDELNKYASAIIDPPRAGAEAQVKQICDSKITNIVYISCSPNSFARDAEKLIAAGFEIRHLAAIDQFKYAAHLEIVAYLSRK